jgi:hypothetical protein
MSMIFRPASIDELLAACTMSTQRLVLAARKRILTAVPTAIERFRPGWGLIGYNAPKYFAFIAVEGGRVRIGFEWGVLLEDWAGLLQGDGRQVRYVDVQSAAVLRAPPLTALLQQAADLKPPGRSSPRTRR